MFGTDGVRGIANSEELPPELALQLGRAAAIVLSRQRDGAGAASPVVVVGRDTRRSGEMLESALVAGLLSAGLDVVRVGVATTPAVAYLVPKLGAVAGAVISASHNPAEHNGIKFFGRDGFKLTDAVEDEIEQGVRRMQQPGEAAPAWPTGLGLGRADDRPAALQAYVDHVVATVPPLRQRRRVVVDCAHGAAFALAPAVYRELGLDVIVIGASPDGDNINAGVGSTHPEQLQQAVVAHGADLGIAHDGDADRVVLVDERGQLVDGDGILYVCGRYLHEQGRLPGDTLVATVMSNLGLELGLRDLGVTLKRTAVGDRYVLEQMLAGGYALGGEQSGHVIFREHSTTGDGILTAVQVLGVLDESGLSLAEAAGRLQRYPQRLINVPVRDREAYRQSEAVAEAVAAAERDLGDRGRVLVRPSGTEPLVRVMVEAMSADECDRVAERLATVIEKALGPA